MLNSHITNYVGQTGKQKSQWVVDGSRGPGEEHDVGTSSPKCLASSVLLVFSVATHNKTKNCCGAADKGRMWYDTLANFLQS